MNSTEPVPTITFADILDAYKNDVLREARGEKIDLAACKDRGVRLCERICASERLDEVGKLIDRDLGLDYGPKTETYLAARQLELQTQLEGETHGR